MLICRELSSIQRFSTFLLYHIILVCQAKKSKYILIHLLLILYNKCFIFINKFVIKSHLLTIRVKTHKRAGDCPSYIGIMVCATASGVTQRLEFTFTLPQGSCHQFSEPSVSHDRAWLLIAHCYQTVAPDIKIRLLSQHSLSLLLFPSFLTLIMPCYE